MNKNESRPQISTKTTQTTHDQFHKVAESNNVVTPAQLRDEVCFRLLCLTLSKLELTEEEQAILDRQEEIFRLAQQQGE